MTKVTVRDIAERCGVTPTVVSAVLNSGSRRSRCSAEKQELIRQTAVEMNYCPNLLARSMVTRQVPVVALMLHLDPSNIAYGSRYFAESVANASMALRESGLEITIVLYRDQEEQIARFSEQAAKGIIGGVISHIAPGNNKEFIRVLHESKLPYVLLGETEIPAVAVNPGGEPQSGKLYAEAQKRYGAERIFLHQANCGCDVLYPYHDIPGYNRFRYDPIVPDPELVGNPRNMIVSMGYEYYLHLNRQMKIASPLVHERAKFEFLIPDGVPRIIVDTNADYLAYAAKLLVRWQLSGEVPECKIHYVASHSKAILKW